METHTNTSRCKDEHTRLMKIINFRFPHQFKKIGLIGAGLILLFLIGYKFYGSNDLLTKDVLRTVMLLFLLVASLSKDTIEDEFIRHIRYQSYVIASVCAVAYSIGLPLVAYGMDVLISQIDTDNVIKFHEISGFEVMFMLVCFQILFFETLKRFERAQ